MKKLIFLTILFPLCALSLRAQTASLSSLTLTGINYNVKAEGFTDSLNYIDAKLTGEGTAENYRFAVHNGKIDTSIVINISGNFTFNFLNSDIQPVKVRVIPAWLSIVPPLIAILLALWLRQVIISLLIGIYLGAVFLNNFNPLTGLLRLIDTYVIKALSDPSHIEIIVFTCLFGGVVGLISKSGGTKGMADLITRFAKKRKSGLLSTWLMGIAIFFDDYANTLIVGNLMRPITDKMRISREKLSFIVDATSAPVVSLFVVSSWIGYEIGLIQHGLSMVGSTENAYDVFLQTIPYRFYPILMLIFVFMVSYFERDFGPMYKAEKRATEKGKVLRDGAKVGSITEKSELFGNEDKARWYNAVVPILVLIIGTIAGLYYTGITSLAQQGITEYGIRDIIGNSDSYIALLWSSFAACGVAAIMIVSQKIMNISDTLDAWFLGVRSMLLALIILTLAWAIGSITQDIKTADFLIGIIGDSISPRFLPVIVFIVCALTSFATGTSWGTMAILMPIVIPLATVVPSFYHYSPMNSEIILHGVISSVLAGSVFGDHCSPISDTTILSSMASGCDHIDHVRTQLPYAVVVAVFCMLIGDIPTAYGFSPYYSIIIIAALLAAIVYFFGKKVTYNISETG